MKEEDVYLAAGKRIKGAEESQMFGKPCFKVNGKAFVSFFEKAMVFKLSGKEHENALKLQGAKLFDPSAKGRPMKEWVQVPYVHAEKWGSLSKAAYDYVSGQ
jgi:hypothetical protein